MRQLALIAVLAACSHDAKPAPPPGPKPTADPSLGGQAQSSGAGTQPTAFHSTVDPPLGGWSTPTSNAPGSTSSSPATTPPPATKPMPAGSPPPATTPTKTVAASPPGAVSPTPPPATAPVAPVAPAAPTPITMRAKQPSTPNSCLKQNRDCMVTLIAAAPGTGGMHGSVKGVLSSDSSVPACPVDLVEGGSRRVASGTAHGGAYEISASAGHYSVSFERCLGCDPGLIDVDIADASVSTVSLACKAAGKP